MAALEVSASTPFVQGAVRVARPILAVALLHRLPEWRCSGLGSAVKWGRRIVDY